MALIPGDKVGSYEIVAPLGAGAMGMVYRARDARLRRDVALKLLPDAFAADVERMARFEREARVLASLNHPNIAQIYGVEQNALVMELVAGESPRGPMSFDEASKIAAQIADALEYAHERGIVHRDLKPANIKVTPDGMVKLLDFGLAKAFPANAASAEKEDSPTLTIEATQMGAIVGTASYMAPEQALGKNVDQRADIWAFGVVLYELLTGLRPFRGEDIQEILGAVVHEPPDISPVPAQARALVEHCLEKDPKKRLRHIGDANLLLGGDAKTAAPRRRSGLPGVALAVVTLWLAALAWVHFRERPPVQQPIRMSVLLPEKSRVLSLAASPDSRYIGMVLAKEGKQQIWVRALDTLEPSMLAGTDEATDLFWSPDSRYIVFFADAKLKKIERSGGPVQTLCDAHAALGGAWNQNGDIVFAALMRIEKVPAAGGAVSDLPKPAAQRDEYPAFLPDGVHYLTKRGYTPGSPEAGIWLNSMSATETRRILPDLSKAEVVEPPPGSDVGDVLFNRAGTLMALPFDMTKLAAAGDPFPIAQGIARSATSDWLAAVSRQGVLAYVSGQRGERQYIWRDREGKILGDAGEAGNVVAISPDGKQLVGDYNGTRVLDVGRNVATMLTFRDGNTNPVWSADGRSIAYGSGGAIYRKLANGAGPAVLLIRAKSYMAPVSWSPDGRYLMYAQVDPGARSELMAIPVEAGAKPFVVVQTPGSDNQGQFSPDGHWVAYSSNESGVTEIYVIPFPPSPDGGKWLVSRGGGVQPRWRRNGKELFYISPDSKMMSVEVSTQPVFQSGNPQALFLTEIVDTGIRTGPMSWDVAPDGRFLIITESSTDTAIQVALNWRAGAKR